MANTKTYKVSGIYNYDEVIPHYNFISGNYEIRISSVVPEHRIKEVLRHKLEDSLYDDGPESAEDIRITDVKYELVADDN